jgi:hypothetical protein
MLLYFAHLTSFWSFASVIAENNRLSEGSVAVTLATSQITGIVGTMLPAVWGDRIPLIRGTCNCGAWVRGQRRRPVGSDRCYNLPVGRPAVSFRLESGPLLSTCPVCTARSHFESDCHGYRNAESRHRRRSSYLLLLYMASRGSDWVMVASLVLALLQWLH